MFMTGLMLLMSSVMNTAGKVLVTILLGLAGNAYTLEMNVCMDSGKLSIDAVNDV